MLNLKINNKEMASITLQGCSFIKHTPTAVTMHNYSERVNLSLQVTLQYIAKCFLVAIETGYKKSDMKVVCIHM